MVEKNEQGRSTPRFIPTHSLPNYSTRHSKAKKQKTKNVSTSRPQMPRSPRRHPGSASMVQSSTSGIHCVDLMASSERFQCLDSQGHPKNMGPASASASRSSKATCLLFIPLGVGDRVRLVFHFLLDPRENPSLGPKK